MAVTKEKYVICTECGRKVATSSERNIKQHFYAVKNFTGITSKYKSKSVKVYDICKKCLKEKCYDDEELKRFNKAKFISVLKDIMNRPYVHKYFESAEKIAKKNNKPDMIFTEYMRRISAVSMLESCWEDGDTYFIKDEFTTNAEEYVEKEDEVFIEVEKSNFVVTPDMVRKWGNGYTPQDYEFLEYNYNEWSTKYKCDTFAEEKTFQFLCLKELEIRKARETNSGNVDRLEETFRKFMNDANVTPRDANASNDAENLNSLGMIIKDIERTEPCFRFKEKDIYKDFDSIGEYLERFVYRPLKNLLTGSRDFDKEFSVETIMSEEGEDE